MIQRKKAHMNISFFQVNAFTSRQFAGNPAVVCLPKKWLEDDQMQQIAAENNVSETAFLVPEEKTLLIRWFTPVTEVALCGHATLAAAYVLSLHFNNCDHSISFQTLKSGILTVSGVEGIYSMKRLGPV